jgi:hypothetical protein
MCSQPDDIQRYLRFPIIVSSQTQQLWDAQSNNWAGYQVQTNSLRLCEVSISEISWVCPKKGDTFGTTIFLLKVTILGYPSISQAMFQQHIIPGNCCRSTKNGGMPRKSIAERLIMWTKRYNAWRDLRREKPPPWCFADVGRVFRLWYIIIPLKIGRWPLYHVQNGRQKFGTPTVHHFMIYFGKMWPGSMTEHGRGWPSWMSPLACPFGSILGIKVIGFDSNIRSIKYFSELD